VGEEKTAIGSWNTAFHVIWC